MHAVQHSLACPRVTMKDCDFSNSGVVASRCVLSYTLKP